MRSSREPSATSDPDSESYRILARTIREVFPGAAVAPALVLGGTDSKHYGEVAEQSFRFVPLRLAPEDLKRIHGHLTATAYPLLEAQGDLAESRLRQRNAKESQAESQDLPASLSGRA